jgi:hexokinase
MPQLSDALKDGQMLALVTGFVGIAIGFAISEYQKRRRHVHTAMEPLPLMLPIPHNGFGLETGTRALSASAIDAAKSLRATLLELEQCFRVPKADLECICQSFVADLELGLSSSYTDDLFRDNAHSKDKNAKESKHERSGKEELRKSTLPMLPSFVERLPTGLEEGTYLAIDFGGTHVRIIKVTLYGSASVSSGTPSSKQSYSGNGFTPNGNNNGPRTAPYTMIQKKMMIPDALKVGSGFTLFAYIAEGVRDFLVEHPVGEGEISLGFTFSFGVQQRSINEGVILGWNKDFKCDDVLGLDPVQLLQDSLRAKGLPTIRVVALVNDTTGTLVAHAFSEPTTQIAAILGTGSNAAYRERTARIRKFGIQESSPGSTMLMNTEFGAFNPDASLSVASPANSKLPGKLGPETGKEGLILPRTPYDVSLDASTQNPGSQLYEKRISGHYVGELVRLVLVDLVQRKKLFKASAHCSSTRNAASDAMSLPGLLGESHAFNASHMSRIERDHSGTLADTKSLLKDVFKVPPHCIDLADLKLVKFVCELVAIRSARLAAAALAGIIHHLGLAALLKENTTRLGASALPTADLALPLSHSDDPIYIAIDGSLFEHYPHYHNRMMDAFRELFGAKADSIRLCLAKDGSGLGAALTAALVHPRHRMDLHYAELKATAPDMPHTGETQPAKKNKHKKSHLPPGFDLSFTTSIAS